MPRALRPDGKVDWDREGELALLDLLGELHAVPWPEAVARISNKSWKDFGKVQPLQLDEARRRLLARPPGDPERIERDQTSHPTPAITYRLENPRLPPTPFDDERGRRRSLHRSLLGWTGDPAGCGHHAERVVIESLYAAAGRGQLLVPTQRRGQIRAVNSYPFSRGPLDALAYLPDIASDPQTPGPMVPMVVEVKNVYEWIYPWSQPLWELLVKTAEVGQHIKLLPVLACPNSAFMARWMGEDIGFLRARYGHQLFTDKADKISPGRFELVRTEFNLDAVQHPVAPFPLLTEFFKEQPRGGRPPRYQVLSARFHKLSKVILRFGALASALKPPTRRAVHNAFMAAARQEADWGFQGGWQAALSSASDQNSDTN